jgi:transposase-like protein
MPRRRRINWPEMVAEYETGDKSVAEFCLEKQIHENSFYRNRKMYKECEQPLVEIKLEKSRRQIESKTLVLRYQDFSIEVPNCFEEQNLKRLLHVLKESV